MTLEEVRQDHEIVSRYVSIVRRLALGDSNRKRIVILRLPPIDAPSHCPDCGVLRHAWESDRCDACRILAENISQEEVDECRPNAGR
jgi:hypothetical protein